MTFFATAIDDPRRHDPSTLARRWADLRAAQPSLRVRDAADALGVSELELAATQVGATARWLDGDLAALLHGLPAVGRCMALTRNPAAVSEVRGRYGGVELASGVGLVHGEAIDLRVFMAHWRYALAIAEGDLRRPDGVRRSVQVFDGAGTAVHKVYLEPDGELTTWEALIEARAAATPPTVDLAPSVSAAARPDADVDAAALGRDWDALTDTHEFFPMLRRHGLTRTQALRLAGGRRARQVSAQALAIVLGDASETARPIMIFVGNRGCIQIHSGPVVRIRRIDRWLNVLDPAFNLHLREELIARAWVVTKPTAAGPVTSLELFDDAGEVIALVFSQRDDRGATEDPGWASLLGHLAEVRHGQR
jgi:putative hemin transport protein